jgi:phosphate transport system substrate-binding protein
MKKLLTLILAGSLVLFIAGCGNGSTSDTNTPPAESAEIIIAGSTAVQPISEAIAEVFMSKNPNIRVNTQGGGSSAGIKAAREGTANIGSSSRDLRSEESGLTETVICKDGIAISVNKENVVNDLSVEQIKEIFSGEVTNWKEVGGTDRNITLVTREAGSGTRGAFEQIVMGKEKISDRAIVQNSTGAVRTIVAGDPNAIGYISLAILDETVKAVTVEGVQVSIDNIINGSYKIQRPFLYLTREAPVGAAKTFIDFVLSDEGQNIIEQEGLVSVK